MLIAQAKEILAAQKNVDNPIDFGISLFNYTWPYVFSLKPDNTVVPNESQMGSTPTYGCHGINKLQRSHTSNAGPASVILATNNTRPTNVRHLTSHVTFQPLNIPIIQVTNVHTVPIPAPTSIMSNKANLRTTASNIQHDQTNNSHNFFL